MNSNQPFEPKPATTQENLISRREQALSKRLSIAFADHSYRDIAYLTEYNAETVRRYLQGKSRVPADFVTQLCLKYPWINLNSILGIQNTGTNSPFRGVSTKQLFEELGQRINLIEENTVSTVLLTCGPPNPERTSDSSINTVK